MKHFRVKLSLSNDFSLQEDQRSEPERWKMSSLEVAQGFR